MQEQVAGWQRWKQQVSPKEVKEGAEAEIDTPCVRLLTCPLPVLVICCHTLDMTLTERWRHHIGILPQRLPTALPPVCLHQCLISSRSLFHTISLPYSPLLFPALSLCFIPCCSAANPSILFLYIFLIHYPPHLPPSCPNLQVFWLLVRPKTLLVSASPHTSSSLSHFLFFPSSKSHCKCCLTCTCFLNTSVTFPQSQTCITSFGFQIAILTASFVIWWHAKFKQIALLCIAGLQQGATTSHL